MFKSLTIIIGLAVVAFLVEHDLYIHIHNRQKENVGKPPVTEELCVSSTCIKAFDLMMYDECRKNKILILNGKEFQCIEIPSINIKKHKKIRV